uniref:SH3 domain-binding glutamic acid-rich-like protein n=1 Tax=Timema cristinae TaxID=61476 RepID=A0A7R9CEP5_TIMCR|nr:unnamed protein product [Timema cristinae]
MVIKVYISGISGNKEQNNLRSNNTKNRIGQKRYKSANEYSPKIFLCNTGTEYHSVDSIIQQVKKHQQRVMMILDSKNIEYTTVDITEPGKENEKEFMQQNSKTNDSKHPLPPQLFNEELYCGYHSVDSIIQQVKKHQQRVMMILDSKNIEYTTVDITEPGKENEKEFMQQNSKTNDSKHPLPPQLFNEELYCGDYEAFDLANEIDELDKFLKISSSVSKAEIILDQSVKEVDNGEVNVNVDVGEAVSDVDKIAKTLESLPSSFSAFISAWDSYAEVMQTFENLTSRLLREKKRLMQNDDVITAFAMLNLQKN